VIVDTSFVKAICKPIRGNKLLVLIVLFRLERSKQGGLCFKNQKSKFKTKEKSTDRCVEQDAARFSLSQYKQNKFQATKALRSANSKTCSNDFVEKLNKIRTSDKATTPCGGTDGSCPFTRSRFPFPKISRLFCICVATIQNFKSI
jgi:ABC-type polar amino acid transport system ATPase subunit